MLVSKEQQPVPQVDFVIRVNDEWQSVNSNDLFAGKKVILFALPGAFTPTCSSTHLPRYNELASIFKAQGVDDIICLSVNDTFVMNAWAQDQDVENITVLPDGNGEFSEQMGMLVDKAALGFGKRSWRYSMLVNDGIIEKMFIEPEVEGDPFEVSDADTMLNYLAPEAAQQQQVTVISKPGCPYCLKAKALLAEQNLKYEELVLGEQISIAGLRALSSRDTVPQVFIDGQHIGGSDDLVSHFS